MKLKPIYLIAFCLISLSAILAYNSLTSAVNPYLTVSQIANKSEYLNRDIQVLATVTDWSPDEDGTLFINLTDGKENVRAVYSGIPPQGLRKNQKIVAIGKVIAPNCLDADQLLTKCPSKYE